MNHTLIFNVTGESSVWQRNHGAYRIAHWLRLNNWDAEVIDYALVWTFDDLVNLAKSRITKNTKFIGFSFLFDKFSDSIDLLKFTVWLNNYHPDIILISGSSMYPEIGSPVDYHINGYGEVALIELLKYLFSNGTEPRTINYHGIKVIDAFMYPAYPMEDYSVYYEDRDFLQPWEFLSIETSRGCIFKCTFCNHPLLGVKDDYTTSAESFEREVNENWNRWGIKNYMSTEETFNDRQDKIKKLGNVIKNLNFEPWFTGYIRLDLLISRSDEKQLLEDMNFYGQYYGIETFHPKTAKAFKKGMDPNRIKEGLLETKEYYEKSGKYRGTVSLIIGGPHEPVDSMYRTLDWLTENWNDHAVMPYPMNIPKGQFTRASELSKNYEKYGYKSMDISYFKEKYPKETFALDKIENSKFESILWENEHLDIVQAINIHRHYNEVIEEKKFKVQNLAMSRFTGSAGSNNPPIEHKLNLSVGELLAETTDGKRQEWQREYIRRKLDWGYDVYK